MRRRRPTHRRQLLAGLATAGTATLATVSGCVTTRSLAQDVGEERRVQPRTPDGEPPFTLAELGGAVGDAGARVVRLETVGTLARLAYQPTTLSRDESVVAVADAFERHVTSDVETSRLDAVVVDDANTAVVDFYVLNRWVEDLEAGRLSREEYHQHVRDTVGARGERATGGRP